MTDLNDPTTLDAVLRSDFRAFLLKCFGTLNENEPFQDNWHIDAVIHHLDKPIRGDVTRSILNLPPRSIKSVAASVVLPAYLLGTDPSCKIASVSYSDDQAMTFARDRQRIVGSSWYRQLFSKLRFTKRTESELTTDQGGGILATSIHGGLTGRGFNWIIIDDPIKTGEGMSEAERKQVNDWFRSTAYTRLNVKSRDRILLIMQRVHEDDLTGHVMTLGEWDVLALKAIATEDERIPISDHQCYHRAEGEALHPEREDLESLDNTKAFIGSYNFASQYQQTPLPPEGNIIKVDWFKRYGGRPDRDKFDQIVQSWDCAAETGKGNSYSVCLTFGIVENRAHVLDVYRDRVEYPALVRQVDRLGRRWGASRIYIEKASNGLPLLQDARKFSGLNLIGVPPRLDKETRAIAASAVIEAGRLYLPEEAPWLDDFLGEILAFPNSRYADQVDSLSQFIRAWEARPGTEFKINLYSLSEPTRPRDRYAERMGSGVFDNLF